MAADHAFQAKAKKTLRSDRFNNRVIEKLIFQAVKPLRKRFTKSLNS